MLTIAKLSRWSIDYYNRTARAAGKAARHAQRANGGLGEYYSEKNTRAPVWLCAGDAHTAASLVGLGGAERTGGAADPDVARWLDDGTAPPRSPRRGAVEHPARHSHSQLRRDGRLYVDMRLIEGRDLQTVLADGPLAALTRERQTSLIKGAACAPSDKTGETR